MNSYFWIGTQEVPWGKSIELYNLTKNVPGHPKGSTVSEETLKELGIWKGKLI